MCYTVSGALWFKHDRADSSVASTLRLNLINLIISASGAAPSDCNLCKATVNTRRVSFKTFSTLRNRTELETKSNQSLEFLRQSPCNCNHWGKDCSRLKDKHAKPQQIESQLQLCLPYDTVKRKKNPKTRK